MPTAGESDAAAAGATTRRPPRLVAPLARPVTQYSLAASIFGAVERPNNVGNWIINIVCWAIMGFIILETARTVYMSCMFLDAALGFR
jgi:hypothetical protein